MATTGNGPEHPRGAAFLIPSKIVIAKTFKPLYASMLSKHRSTRSMLSSQCYREPSKSNFWKCWMDGLNNVYVVCNGLHFYFILPRRESWQHEFLAPICGRWSECRPCQHLEEEEKERKWRSYISRTKRIHREYSWSKLNMGSFSRHYNDKWHGSEYVFDLPCLTHV